MQFLKIETTTHGCADMHITRTNAQCNVEISKQFFIKYANIYFGHKDKVYVIIKQLIIDVFGMCVDGYVEELKKTG